jgi:hypothetical protein
MGDGFEDCDPSTDTAVEGSDEDGPSCNIAGDDGAAADSVVN